MNVIPITNEGQVVLIEQFRHGVSRVTLEVPGGEVDPGETPEQSAMRRELQTRLRDALADLPRREGSVFSLRYFEGLTLNEIAESLEISYTAAGAALSRARGKLEYIFSPTKAEEEL